jgi:hypothetical protein
MLDSGRLIGIIGGRKIFTQVERLFIGCTVTFLKVHSVDRGAGGSTLDTAFILTGHSALRQLSGEFMKFIFRLVDIHATRSGGTRDGAVETTHLEEESQMRGEVLTCRQESLLIYMSDTPKPAVFYKGKVPTGP